MRAAAAAFASGSAESLLYASAYLSFSLGHVATNQRMSRRASPFASFDSSARQASMSSSRFFFARSMESRMACASSASPGYLLFSAVLNGASAAPSPFVLPMM